MNLSPTGHRHNDDAQTRFWKWQGFRLVYILCVIFVLPAVIIGGFAIFLAIYSPDEFVKSVRSRPQVAVDPLQSPSSFVRENALLQIVNGPVDRERRDVVEKVRTLLRDPNPKIQELAITALGNCGNAEDVPILLELAKDRFSVFVRPQICVTLSKIGGEESIDALVDILCMGPMEREHSLAALSQDRPAAELALLRRAAGANADEQRTICFALGRLGSEQSRLYLESTAAAEDSQLSAAAKQALSTLAKPPSNPR